MLFKIHKCFGILTDKFARFRHEAMENMKYFTITEIQSSKRTYKIEKKCDTSE